MDDNTQDDGGACAPPLPATKEGKRGTGIKTPNTREAPGSKFQARSSKRGPRFGAWNLGFLWCLELGFWCFDAGTSLELGVWCLVFRSAVAQKLRSPGRGVNHSGMVI